MEGKKKEFESLLDEYGIMEASAQSSFTHGKIDISTAQSADARKMRRQLLAMYEQARIDGAAEFLLAAVCKGGFISEANAGYAYFYRDCDSVKGETKEQIAARLLGE